MTFIHISDIHIGKTLSDFPLIDDQKFILQKIVDIVNEYNPDAVVIAGDNYDKYAPNTDAIKMLDWFLTSLADSGKPILMIAGNHDNGQMIHYGAAIFKKGNVIISGSYNGKLTTWSFNDDFGEVQFHLLPYIKPYYVHSFFPDIQIKNYSDAIKAVLHEVNFNDNNRHVLLSHQYYNATDSSVEKSESELPSSIGGEDMIDADLVARFDYVALGHLHKAQQVGKKGNIYYCGTPLKYSKSEYSNKKSVNLVTLGKQGSVKVEKIVLEPLHDIIKIRGSLSELTSDLFVKDYNTEDDYFYPVLTDEDEPPDVYDKLKRVYKKLLLPIEYDNSKTKAILPGNVSNFDGGEVDLHDIDNLFSLFEELFYNYHKRIMTDEESAEIKKRLSDGGEDVQ
jgi:exonuclease SbcD